MRVEAGLGKRLGDNLHQAGLPELHCGNVHRDRQSGMPRIMPGLGLAAGVLQHPGANFRDQPGLVGKRNEIVRLQQAHFRMAPAHQRFHAGQRTRDDIEIGLVLEQQFVPRHGFAQRALEHQLRACQRAHFARVELVVVAPQALRPEHRRFGVYQQFGHIIAIPRRRDNADAHGNMEFQRALDERSDESLPDLLRRVARLPLAADVAEKHRELVAAASGDHALAGHAFLQALRDLADQRVPDFVAKAIVDAQEPVDIQKIDGGRLSFGLQQLAADVIAEQVAVGQSGQAVIKGELVDASIGLLLGAAHGRAMDLPLHRRQQAGEVAFYNRILRTAAHGRDFDVLADIARIDDERDVLAAFLQQIKRLERTETRHGMIGNDDIPFGIEQCRAHVLGAVHPGIGDIAVCPGQFGIQKTRVVLRVLDYQEAYVLVCHNCTQVSARSARHAIPIQRMLQILLLQRRACNCMSQRARTGTSRPRAAMRSI